MKKYDIQPDKKGFFGNYGGQIIPDQLKPIFDEIADFYAKIKDTKEFKDEMNYYRKNYIGRPSPIYFAEKLSKKYGGAKIYLKREDLNHTGAHKINHTIGEALIAKKMGKKKIVAETGAGQHGVALATAAAVVGLPCEIHMGEIDIAKQAPNVTRMKILGAKVVPVTQGTKTLKDAVDSAFMEFVKDPQNIFFGIGSVVGPHPFPMMVRDFQRIVGEEAREQFLEMTGKLPDNLVACVGGGSNAIGLFSAFLEDEDVKIYGVEPSGKGLQPGNHAATLTLGEPGNIHGMHTYLLQDKDGNPEPVYSIASGLDYPGVGPQHSFLKDIKRVEYKLASDKECLDSFMELSQLEGIIPALESAHAIAYACKLAADLSPDQTILVNLSGRGDKDIDYVVESLHI
ncbi:MAG: tryptophan synthase subunit beta, tryptophan synthase beta chain [Candidatus Peregrinibacteria bacterium GW2011_GWC2_39_14]|nr:MAG: Tryptophan synthase beta chain [Candidatus Peregrinibacteria bacterium GW2011_GWA2_38_36]KKR07119.1 MAG: tryptophan synthase subunit beta, tryptophan synthase beta chain [Candidatus Peregrinibacteria bacterium GW2011_GWC2_39_14]